MKRFILILVVSATAFSAAFPAGGGAFSGVADVKLHGYVGRRIDQCIEQRVMGQNADELIAPFRAQQETQGRWASEFWGKWVQGAMSAYRYNRDPALLAKIRDAQQKLRACQLPGGFIGDYTPEKETTGWDIWGRKYTLLGLVKWYRLTGDKAALKAACRLLDYTLTQVGPHGKPIYECGYYKGMPPMSILEPVVFMYQETKNERYLDFAKYIAEASESPNGPQLIRKADVPVAFRFPLQPGDTWWSIENGQKGYEMMSCYVGLLELYKMTGETAYMQAAEKTWQHIVEEEINVAGGACSLECWYEGRKLQTHPALHTMETCVTFTWMQFCERLLEMTGNPKYADQIELTMYNALMAAMKWDGSQIVKYVPLEGFRREGEHQCDVRINCCNANGPRAFAMIPRVAYRTPSVARLDINLFIPSEATIKLGKRNIVLRQETSYPEEGVVSIRVNPDKPVQADIALRIPAWSKHTDVAVNGEKIEAKSGTYCVISREWKAGDEIRLTLDMTARMVTQDHQAAIVRGPVVLARDTRFRDGFVDECMILPNKDGVVELTRVQSPEKMWMAFTMPVVHGYYYDQAQDRAVVHLCDFASAGNTWDESERYRTWIPLLYIPQ
ncbi:MAG: glycoside hydrolase family 127 protein [Bacteroidaceae bacterium]|nr:glycoside hydrolase family 127 protein [Bacteroidaceae bacterium]